MIHLFIVLFIVILMVSMQAKKSNAAQTLLTSDKHHKRKITLMPFLRDVLFCPREAERAVLQQCLQNAEGQLQQSEIAMKEGCELTRCIIILGGRLWKPFLSNHRITFSWFSVS